MNYNSERVLFTQDDSARTSDHSIFKEYTAFSSYHAMQATKVQTTRSNLENGYNDVSDDPRIVS